VKATVPYVDEYVFYDSQDRRGRPALEMARLLQGAIPATVPSTVVPDRETAIREAWALVRPGDRLVLIVDEVAGARDALHRLAGAADDASCISPITVDVGVA